MKKTTSGFTIVELLIVIVVIAILAAISIVAYTGIQNRANDTAVQSDIDNFAKKIMLYHAEHGEYPEGRYGASPIGVGGFSLARASYATNVPNFYYCEGLVSGNPVFAVGAVSKSDDAYYYLSSQGGVQPYAGGRSGMVGWCTGMLSGVAEGYTRSHGYDTSTQAWFSWTE